MRLVKILGTRRFGTLHLKGVSLFDASPVSQTLWDGANVYFAFLKYL